MCKPVWSLNQDIANLPLFAGVPPESLTRIVRGCVRRTVELRERIYWQGEAPEAFYVIRAGHVRLAVASPGGDEKVIDILSAGQLFGLAELFGGRIHTSFAEAVTAVSLIEIDAGSLFHAIGAHPDLALRILSAVAGQCAALQLDVIASSFRSGTDRLVDYLLRLAGRNLRPGYEASIELPVSKRLIAALEVEAARYGRLVTQVADRFGLEPLGPQIRGLDAVFQEFGRGDLHVSLDWDNWMGFQVVHLRRRPLFPSGGRNMRRCHFSLHHVDGLHRLRLRRRRLVI